MTYDARGFRRTLREIHGGDVFDGEFTIRSSRHIDPAERESPWINVALAVPAFFAICLTLLVGLGLVVAGGFVVWALIFAH